MAVNETDLRTTSNNLIGEAIKQIRLNSNRSLEEFADTIHLDKDELLEMEGGNREVENETIFLVSNMYDVDASMLLLGQIERKVSRDELLQGMQEIKAALDELRADNQYFRDFIGRWGLSEVLVSGHIENRLNDENRHQVEEVADYEYAIYDNRKNEFVKNPDGSAKVWSSEREAESIAAEMNKAITDIVGESGASADADKDEPADSIAEVSADINKHVDENNPDAEPLLPESEVSEDARDITPRL